MTINIFMQKKGRMSNMEDKKVMIDLKDDVEDTRDKYLDFDMFDFVYSLVCTVTAWEASLSPLDHPLEKFDKPHTNKRYRYDSDGNEVKATDDTSIEHPRVVSDSSDAIMLYSDNKEHFNDIMEVCKLYGFNFDGPNRHTAQSYYWEWSFKIYIPMASHNYPMMIEDYFDSIGIPLEKVMHQRWCTKYRNKMARLQKESDATLNELKLNRLYNEAVKGAWQRGDIPLTEHYDKLVEKLVEEGITYKKTLLRKKFMDEFADEECDDSLVVTELFA